MKYWLMKSEPGCYSIDHLKKDGKTVWSGVRNYQARNFMRDDMQVGDLILFYHSNAEPAGVAGIARVCQKAHPDSTAWDKKDEHYDPKSTPDHPIWMMVGVEFVKKFKNFVSLPEMRKQSALHDMMVLQRGSRLSVQPVEKFHFQILEKLGQN